MKTRHWILLVAVFAVVGSLLLQTNTRAASRLLPFQGRLSDAQGNVIADGPHTVQFKIYDAPVGGTAVWDGEVQKLTVNAGLVSTLLGTKANLAGVDFDRELYLELTVDANGDGQITAADPPLLPRQSILPAVFAAESADSRRLAGYDWTPIFGTNNPTGPLPGSKLAENSVPGSRIVSNSITSSQIAPGSILPDRLASRSLTAAQLAANSITTNELAQAVLEMLADQLAPPGTIVAFGGENIPVGWLLCDGRGFTAAQYPRLWAAISTNWGGNANSFYIPDLRGLFLRGVAGPASFDPDAGSRTEIKSGGNTGNRVGSWQPDAFQGHRHDFYMGRWGIQTSGNFDNNWLVFANNFGNRGNDYVREAASDGANGSPRVAAETRPKNAYVNYIIKY